MISKRRISSSRGKKSQFLRSKTTVVSQIYVDNSPTFSSSSSHQSLVLLRSRSLVLRYRSIRRLLSSISYSSWTSVPLGRLFLRFRRASSSLYLSLSKIVFLSALYIIHTDRKTIWWMSLLKKKGTNVRALLRCSNNNSTYAREIKQQQTRSRLRLFAPPLRVMNFDTRRFIVCVVVRKWIYTEI